MSKTTAILILFSAAVLEAGGDAIVRSGLHASGTARTLWFLAGAVVLFAYGRVVNSPPWDFGKLLGIYVVFFFLVAQVINWIFFKQQPSVAVLLGGALILSGGAVIALSNR
jgi:small multidrug resistance family-3 protein